MDHTTVLRWVQRYAPEINKRMRPYLKMRGTSYRLDETYVKVGTEWKYLYRAVDLAGDTIEFMLSAKRDVSAAKRFFKKMMRAEHHRLPFSISVDKNAAPGSLQHFTSGAYCAEGLQAQASKIPE